MPEYTGLIDQTPPSRGVFCVRCVYPPAGEVRLLLGEGRRYLVTLLFAAIGRAVGPGKVWRKREFSIDTGPAGKHAEFK